MSFPLVCRETPFSYYIIYKYDQCVLSSFATLCLNVLGRLLLCTQNSPAFVLRPQQSPST